MANEPEMSTHPSIVINYGIYYMKIQKIRDENVYRFLYAQFGGLVGLERLRVERTCVRTCWVLRTSLERQFYGAESLRNRSSVLYGG